MKATKIEPIIRDYEAYHQDPVNIKVHLICVPLIMLSVLGLLNALPTGSGVPGAGHLMAALFLGYYLIFARGYFTACLILFALLIAADLLLSQLPIALYSGLNISVFILAWIGQFWGHRREGNRPAFVENSSRTIHYMFMAPLLVVRHIHQLFS